MSPLTGYLHPAYAASLSEWGQPVELPASRGWLLERRVPHTEFSDAMGCYPVFCCADWTGLHDDLQQMRDKFVSVTLVTDPFGDYDESLLLRCFDRAVPFKEHFVADLNQPVNELANLHHRKHARRALKDLLVEAVNDPVTAIDEWVSLYDNLNRRHQITGIRAFSRAAFASQLQIPGMCAIRAKWAETNETVGIQLWYIQGTCVYSHLSAYSDLGYKKRVAYALNWTANTFFAGKARWLVLGAGAGTGSGVGGLTEYKQGWSTGTRTTWLCGRILQPERYAALVAQSGKTDTSYFPAYRHGEF